VCRAARARASGKARYVMQPDGSPDSVPTCERQADVSTGRRGSATCPNLNLLGSREPHIYGHTTLQEIDVGLRTRVVSWDCWSQTFQSNQEGALIIDRVCSGRAGRRVVSIITRRADRITSCLSARRQSRTCACPPWKSTCPTFMHAEEFRHRSLLAPVCPGPDPGLATCGLTGWRWRRSRSFFTSRPFGAQAPSPDVELSSAKPRPAVASPKKGALPR